MVAHINEPPPVASRLVPELPRAADKVIQRAMEKDPANGRSPPRRSCTGSPSRSAPAPACVPRHRSPDPRSAASLPTRGIQVALLAPVFLVAYLIGASL